jgi:WD40 repeat protein
MIRLIQEVREHTKAVTCLYVSSSGDKLYSGSSDKTIRVSRPSPRKIKMIKFTDKTISPRQKKIKMIIGFSV